MKSDATLSATREQDLTMELHAKIKAAHAVIEKWDDALNTERD